MKTRYLLNSLIVAVVALAAVPATAQLPRRPGPTRPVPPGGETVKDSAIRSPVDIRANMSRLRAQNKLKGGKNLVFSDANGVKLWAVSANGRISGWEATDRDGKPLPIRYNQTQPQTAASDAVKCSVCVITIVNGQQSTSCYTIDCNDMPQPKPKDRQ